MENNQLIFYSTPQGHIKVEVIFESETFWLSQKRMAELFGVDVRTVNEHLKNIFKTGELTEGSVIWNFRTTDADMLGEVHTLMQNLNNLAPIDDNEKFPERLALGTTVIQGSYRTTFK